MKINIKFQGDERYILELILNMAHQMNLQQAQLWLGIYGLTVQMHKDDFIYYAKLMEERK